jgi:hypothetical protein
MPGIGMASRRVLENRQTTMNLEWSYNRTNEGMRPVWGRWRWTLKGILEVLGRTTCLFFFHYIFSCSMEWLEMGFWTIGFTDHLQIVTTNNYNTIAHFHTLQITTAHTKSFPACSVFTRQFLVTASNNGYSSASVLPSNWALLQLQLSLNSQTNRLSSNIVPCL